MKKILISCFLIMIPLVVPSFAGNVTVTLMGQNPLTINVRGNTIDEEAGGMSIYLYFRDDGVTSLDIANVDASQLVTTWGWGTFTETKLIESGSWTFGSLTFTQRLQYINSGIMSLDDKWLTTGIDALVLSFTTVGSGHAHLEVIGTDGLPDWSGTGHNFTISNQDITLPVEMSIFTAAVVEDKVQLRWVTQSEINNLGFEVYRADDEFGYYAKIASYETQPSLEGAGNSNTQHEYTYTDELISNGGTYWYKLADVDYQGNKTFHGPISVEAVDLIPEEYALHQNFPNPFNPETSIRYEVPVVSVQQKVELVVYNSLGMPVRTLVSGSIAPGTHTVKWYGKNDQGRQMASGIYFLRLQAGTFNQTRKMLLLR